MQTIYLPTFAAKKGDVQTMYDLLQREVLDRHGDRFDIGLEIIGAADHFTDGATLDAMIKNVHGVAGDVKTVVHGFSGLDVYTKGIADMGKAVGRELLATYRALAERLGSGYVHVHGAAGYRGCEAPADKIKILERIRENMLNVWGGDRSIAVGIENLPLPSACDFDENPETVWSDCVEGVEDCLEVVGDTGLKVTFDTAHYGINGKAGKMDLVHPVRRLGDRLHHLHVGDAEGNWVPHKSRAYDGLVPGDGKIGEEAFATFFRYIKDNHPDLGICIEVHNKDFKDPAESRESVRRTVNWLL